MQRDNWGPFQTALRVSPTDLVFLSQDANKSNGTCSVCHAVRQLHLGWHDTEARTRAQSMSWFRQSTNLIDLIAQHRLISASGLQHHHWRYTTIQYHQWKSCLLYVTIVWLPDMPKWHLSLTVYTIWPGEQVCYRSPDVLQIFDKRIMHFQKRSHLIFSVI